MSLKTIFRICVPLLVFAGIASREGRVCAAEPESPPAAIVSGRVLDPQGRPARGATIHLIAHSRFGPATATTGKDGAFSFPVELGGIYRLTAEKKGFGAGRRAEPLRIQGSATGIEVRLNRPASLSGRVVGLTAKELAGLSLTLEDQHEGAEGTLKVEADGRYRVVDLPPGDCRLQAQARNRSAAASATLAEGEEKSLDVVFPHLTPVRAGCSDRTALRPPEPRSAARAPATTWETLLPGRTAASCPSLPKNAVVWARVRNGAPVSAPVDVASGPVEGIEIHLRPSLALTGRLLGLRDPGCKLSVSAQGAAPFVQDGHVETPGHYEIAGLGTGTWGLTATCGEQSARGSLQIGPEDAAPTFDLDFGPGPRVLSGRVLGEPGRHFEVNLEQRFAPASPLGHAEVASGGTFRFANLQPGPYVIYIMEPDLPSDSITRLPYRSDGEEILGSGDAYESIDQMDVDLQTDREITLDVRDGRPGGGGVP